MRQLDYSRVENILIKWLQQRVSEAGASGVVVGLSGGIDSSVTGVICKKAFADQLLGIMMPCHSKEQDTQDARLLAERYHINYLVKDLSSVYDQYLELFAVQETEEQMLAFANIKPRLRMVTLYYYAAELNYLVVGTDNWSELKIGYFTKYGDGGVDLAPLGRLVKTAVRELARYLDIPQAIIEKTPAAGLWQGQTDEKEMGFTYQVLDRYILTGEAKPEEKARIEELAGKSVHKLQPLPIPERRLFL